MKNSQVSELSSTAYLISALFSHGGVAGFCSLMCILYLAHSISADRKERLEGERK